MEQIEKARNPIIKEFNADVKNLEIEKTKTKKKRTTIPDVNSENIIIEN